MATVRHSSCRIDFNPADVTGKATITVSDEDGVPLECVNIKMTHILAAVSKMAMVLVRRDAAIARVIGEMDDEVNEKRSDEVETSALAHARVCDVVAPHTSEQCVSIVRSTSVVMEITDPQAMTAERHAKICSTKGSHLGTDCTPIGPSDPDGVCALVADAGAPAGSHPMCDFQCGECRDT